MDVTSTSSVGALTGSTTSAQTSTAATSLTSDFETFLQMLTAQAKYQDPLDPIDSSEYSAQLAQFSMVEQQVQTNELMASLLSQLGTSSIASLAGLIGMEARVATAAYFDGSPVSLVPNPAAISDSVQLAVYDSEGNEVDRRTLPVSADPYEWDGIGPDGNPLPQEHYVFRVASWANGELILDEVAESYALIVEAQGVDGETVVVLEGGYTLPAVDITGLREAT